MTIRSSSPRSTAPYQTLAPSPISTSPMITAVGAMKTFWPMRGCLPSYSIIIFLATHQVYLDLSIASSASLRGSGAGSEVFANAPIKSSEVAVHRPARSDHCDPQQSAAQAVKEHSPIEPVQVAG